MGVRGSSEAWRRGRVKYSGGCSSSHKSAAAGRVDHSLLSFKRVTEVAASPRQGKPVRPFVSIVFKSCKNLGALFLHSACCCMTPHRWRFPGVGEYQCFDRYMLADLRAAAAAAGHPEWGHGGPHDAGHYNSRSWDTGFFKSQGGRWQSDYGHFFQSWYRWGSWRLSVQL